ncbi:hypothetical protein ABF81_16480 [Enterobacter hormaechei subsp. steigerwaltii]|nr:hypothetical protein ABF81_16480 [Enterobacter hormaechei subsp. steigerwaltii]KZQ36919.1 hypothetical protein A3N44_01190 [Enterobacter hormaechei subsp. steigerwaltii]
MQVGQPVSLLYKRRKTFLVSALGVYRIVSGEIYDFEVNEHIKIRHTGEILNMFRQTYSFP